MAITINWNTRVIYIPKADLTFVSGSLYELDVNDLRLTLKDLEDDDEGMGFPDTHRHNTEVVLSGITYARTFEIINGYTVEIEDDGSYYTVRCVGANHNLADVKVVNCVSLIIGNSAGLINSGGGSGGLTGPQETALNELHAMMSELYKIHGLLTGTPLVVGPTTRVAGDISQTVAESSGTVTVTRT